MRFGQHQAYQFRHQQHRQRLRVSQLALLNIQAVFLTARCLKLPSGRSASVAYLFSRNGSIRFQPAEGTDPDDALNAAIDVGAEDVDMGDDGEIEVRYVLVNKSYYTYQSHPRLAGHHGT